MSSRHKKTKKDLDLRQMHSGVVIESGFGFFPHTLSVLLSIVLTVSLLMMPIFRASAEEVQNTEASSSAEEDVVVSEEMVEEVIAEEESVGEETGGDTTAADALEEEPEEESISAEDQTLTETLAEEVDETVTVFEEEGAQGTTTDAEMNDGEKATSTVFDNEEEGSDSYGDVGTTTPSQAASTTPSTPNTTASTTSTSTNVGDIGTSTSNSAGGGSDVKEDIVGETAEEEVSTTTTASTTEGVVAGTEPTATPEEEVNTPVKPADLTSTTTPTIVSEPVNVVVNDTNRFQFGVNECVSVGDGSFYCSRADGEEMPTSEHVFTDYDADGDREIYAVINGKTVQITDNTIDDDEPFYDPVSNRIVWHASVSGRYQIFSYSIDERSLTKLTDTTHNNMQATAYDDVTVWQAWINDNWEVVLLEDGEVTQLTDNRTHDIAPHVRGDYILWQAFEGDAWYVKVYDRATGLTETIEGSAGASAENPRFVLVYDTKNEYGDIETRGYDLESKQVVPLSSTPAPIPERLPEPEKSGEERALIQQSSPKTETRTVETDGGDGDGTGDNPDAAMATSTDDIIVPANGPVESSTTTIQAEEDASFDLIIPPLSSTTTDTLSTSSDDGQ